MAIKRKNLPENVNRVLETLIWEVDTNNPVLHNWAAEYGKYFRSIVDYELFLKTPFDIELPVHVANQITAKYQDDEEIGGIVFLSFVKSENILKFKADNFVFIKNAVEDYFEDKKKLGSYFPETESFLKALNENFQMKSVEQILFPVFLHSHPSVTGNYTRDENSWHHMNLSEGDKGFARRAKIKVADCNFNFMNVVLTGGAENYRMQFFGKNVTPYDLEHIKDKNVRQGISDVTDSLTKNQFWNILMKSSLDLFYTYTELQGTTAQKNLLKMQTNDFVDNKIYFAKLERFKSTIIHIPKYEIENIKQ